ncbi:hypothetical protein GBAR_LOCUS25745 [Geodia barretti]|nr:hypothetical protein GBAR_LOCUS25745 [Geodia barretti]
MSVDGKTYYLNHSCVSKFSDKWTGKIKPPFEKKLLIGRVTQRLHVEVRKEDNRLHVPVGTRLYKLEAVELSEDSAA